MIHGSLLCTIMLDGYAILGLFEHLDMSSSLVISALKKEGALAFKAKKTKDAQVEQVKKNKDAITALEKFVKEFKQKNTNLQF